MEDKEVLILDETGGTLPAGHIGEIAIQAASSLLDIGAGRISPPRSFCPTPKEATGESTAWEI